MKKKLIISLSIAGIIVILVLIAIAMIGRYKVTTIYVEGNVHYTNEQIIDMVMNGPLGDNSLYLNFKYKDKGISDVPFVQKMDVEILAPDTIRIMVYEKALAGYIEHLGKYMYFDKDGIVVEVSDERTPTIPQVTGLSFDHVVLNSPLPIDSPDIFSDILDITKLLNKYDIRADRIAFDKARHKTLWFGNARVSLGSNENIGEKILKLKSILPELEGKSGLLRMDNYSEEVKNITFELDN